MKLRDGIRMDFWILCHFELLHHISTLTKLQYIARKNVLLKNNEFKNDLFYQTTRKFDAQCDSNEGQRKKSGWVLMCTDLRTKVRINLPLQTGFRPFASLVQFQLKKRKTERSHVERTFRFISIKTMQLLYTYERKRIA